MLGAAENEIRYIVKDNVIINIVKVAILTQDYPVYLEFFIKETYVMTPVVTVNVNVDE